MMMKTVTNQLPQSFVQRLKKILTADNFQSYSASLDLDKMTSFRVNTLKITVPELLERLLQYGISPISLDWCAEGFSIVKEQRRLLTQTLEFKDGFIYIQNPASIFASLVLDPQPGEEILDLAAAPGGKTLHIAALMKDQGRIAAVEPVKDRFYRLKLNIKRAGANIIKTYCKDGANIGRLVPARFDRVLLDAPCSSEGRFDLTDPSSFSYWSEQKIVEMSRKQKRLIYSAVQSLKPNGILVYCTCAFSPEENESIISYAMNKFPETLEILPIAVPFENFQTGLSAWQKEVFSPLLINAIRIIPNEKMNGFFICKLRKK